MLQQGPPTSRERPQLGSAEGPGQPNKLQQGPSTSQERPNDGSAEGPKQPKKLQQGLPPTTASTKASSRCLEDQEPPDNLSLQSRIHVILEEEEEKESPSFGSCRPLRQVADSGPKSKVR